METARDVASINLGVTDSIAIPKSGVRVRILASEELWTYGMRQHLVFLINPSEVLTSFAAAAGFDQKQNPTKLRGEEVAHVVKAVLEMDDRGFTPELSIFATNPKD